MEFHGGKKSNYFYKNPDSTKDKISKISNGFNMKIFDEFKRIQPKLNVFIFCSNKQVAEIMKWSQDNKYITNLLAWHKTDAPPFTNNVYISDLEFIVHIRQSGATFHKGHSKLYQSTKIRGEHPTIKPLELIERFIKSSSNEGDIILDPFVGSGTTCVAAKKLNRKYIGIDIEEKYCNLTTQRLNEVS